MGIGQILKKIDAFPKIIDIEVNKTFSGALREINIAKATSPLKINFRSFSDCHFRYSDDIPRALGAQRLSHAADVRGTVCRHDARPQTANQPGCGGSVDLLRLPLARCDGQHR